MGVVNDWLQWNLTNPKSLGPEGSEICEMHNMV